MTLDFYVDLIIVRIEFRTLYTFGKFSHKRLEKILNMTQLPIIDISALHSPSEVELCAIGSQLCEASQDLGFFYICGHGVDKEIIDSAFDVAQSFFQLPLSVKNEVKVSGSHRGFLSIGESTMEGYRGADQKESYIWGLDTKDEKHLESALVSENQWSNALPEMRQILNDYFEEIHRCTWKLLRAIAVSLELEENYFVAHFDVPTSRGSLIYYPPSLSETTRYGVSPHTDFGCISVLAQRSSGLQVQNLDGEWFKVSPIEGTFVVNIGDLFSRWTNGKFRSVPHCVVNENSDARYSVVVFVDPNSDTGDQPYFERAGPS